jgi:transcription termination factor NusB
MGIAESHFNDQKAVIIDDIIRIAQKYGDQDDYKFINAILDKVIP